MIVIAKKKVNCGVVVTVTYETPCERENRMHTIEVISDGATVGLGEWKTVGPCFTYLKQLSKLFADAEKALAQGRKSSLKWTWRGVAVLNKERG